MTECRVILSVPVIVCTTSTIESLNTNLVDTHRKVLKILICVEVHVETLCTSRFCTTGTKARTAPTSKVIYCIECRVSDCSSHILWIVRSSFTCLEVEDSLLNSLLSSLKLSKRARCIVINSFSSREINRRISSLALLNQVLERDSLVVTREALEIDSLIIFLRNENPFVSKSSAFIISLKASYEVCVCKVYTEFLTTHDNWSSCNLTCFRICCSKRTIEVNISQESRLL